MWQTTYKRYVRSKLFKIAYNYFSIAFLRYSTYKPRDILTMLNEMIEATQGGVFREQDFLAILGNYSSYIEGELKDYLLIYMSDDDFADFRAFFAYFAGHREFDYKFFIETHLSYIKYLRELGRSIPPNMNTAQEALQLLYDANIIGYKEKRQDWRMYWSYKERSYANMRPQVKLGGNYMFHLAYAKAFDIL